jgi:glycosyl hydrolase family 28
VAEEHDGILKSIDRRHFLRQAGALTAGSIFCGTITSCASYDINIPCLGPAAAPAPVAGMTYIRASQIGCALDCDLKSGESRFGGGRATDDGPRINAALAGASATNPITLIIDGSALVSGLFLPSGGHWGIAGLGCGTGFFVKNGANNDCIHNGPPDAAVPFNPETLAPTRGMNVSLSNFTVNGNQQRNSTSGNRLGSNVAWYCGINLMNLDHVTMENVVVVNTPAFHIRLSNVGNVSVSGCVMQSEGSGTDGVHIDGPSNDIAITNCSFMTGDDSIALNCPEGYSGDISRVQVSGCKFNSWSLMRLYTTIGGQNKFKISSVTVNECTGRFVEAAFLIGLSSGSLPQSVGSLSVSNCTLTSPTILGIAENFGTIELQNIVFVPSWSTGTWSAPQVNLTPAFLRPSPAIGTLSFEGARLSFQNCTIQRSRNLSVAAVILENQSSIGNLEFNGFGVQDGGSYSALRGLLNVEGGSVGELVLDSLDCTNIEAPVEPGGFSLVGTICGAGVLATGWEFPDSVMANNVPYISASTGRPSIKIDGVVEPYP